MRKIDSSSFNKRLFSEILELKNLIENVSPEHIEQLDTELVGRANQYLSLLGDSTFADNSNFNSIEVSKLKQLINYITTSKKLHRIERRVDAITKKDTKGLSEKGVYSEGQSTYATPTGYDGRASFVYPRIRLVRKVFDLDENEDTVVVGYTTSVMSLIDVLLHTQGENINYAGGEYKAAPVDGDINSKLEIVKNKDRITINHKLNLRDTYQNYLAYAIKENWFDQAYNNPSNPPEIQETEIQDIWLDVFMLYWRNK